MQAENDNKAIPSISSTSNTTKIKTSKPKKPIQCVEISRADDGTIITTKITSQASSASNSLQIPQTGVSKSSRVVLAPGYSQLDWMRLVNSGVDLAGNDGKLQTFTKSEVRKHRTADDCWIIYEKKVYNITKYFKYHPGGVDELMKGAGKDATRLIRTAHSFVNVHTMLATCLVGTLADSY